MEEFLFLDHLSGLHLFASAWKELAPNIQRGKSLLPKKVKLLVELDEWPGLDRAIYGLRDSSALGIDCNVKPTVTKVQK